MAKRRRPATPEPLPAVTLDRAARLCRLIHLLGGDSQPRSALLLKLRQDVRGFYRDLEFLRSVGIDVALKEGRYALRGSVADALGRLMLPDPHLTIGEAVQLSKGRTAAHRKLKDLLGQVLPT